MPHCGLRTEIYIVKDGREEQRKKMMPAKELLVRGVTAESASLTGSSSSSLLNRRVTNKFIFSLKGLFLLIWFPSSFLLLSSSFGFLFRSSLLTTQTDLFRFCFCFHRFCNHSLHFRVWSCKSGTFINTGLVCGNFLLIYELEIKMQKLSVELFCFIFSLWHFKSLRGYFPVSSHLVGLFSGGLLLWLTHLA